MTDDEYLAQLEKWYPNFYIFRVSKGSKEWGFYMPKEQAPRFTNKSARNLIIAAYNSYKKKLEDMQQRRKR